MSLQSITQLVAPEFAQFKKIIINNIDSNIGLTSDISNYIFKSGGKKIRPLLLLLIAKACSYQGEQHILAAAAIEYFHTATLLHDDVIDESKMRRGESTANEKWSSKASILVGDILLTQSIQFMTKANNMPMLTVLINAAHDIINGEVQQLANSHLGELSIEDYFEVIKAKTALLFSAASEIGAMTSTSSINVVSQMRSYGLHLGNAFQIVDDLLDYKSTTETLGKNRGDDLREGKITLPLIYAMQEATSDELTMIQNSLKQGSDEYLDEIIQIMQRTKAFDKTYQTAQEQANKALLALNDLEDNQYKRALESIVNFTLNRSH